jgi:hypothetical protein
MGKWTKALGKHCKLESICCHQYQRTVHRNKSGITTVVVTVWKCDDPYNLARIRGDWDFQMLPLGVSLKQLTSKNCLTDRVPQFSFLETRSTEIQRCSQKDWEQRSLTRMDENMVACSYGGTTHRISTFVHEDMSPVTQQWVKPNPREHMVQGHLKFKTGRNWSMSLGASDY